MHKHNKRMIRNLVGGLQHKSSSRLLSDLQMWDVALGVFL